MGKSPTLGIVVPCYNEADALGETWQVLLSKLNSLIQDQAISANSFVGFVDDGSSDGTWGILEDFQKKSSHIKALKLAGNRGHQNALLAGLDTFSQFADVLISIDADLQDDVSAMGTMLSQYKEGSDIVYGVRKRRDTDSWFKKYSALLFYTIMNFLGVSIVYNHADYRLTSKRAVEALREYREERLFLRGVFPLMGFPSSVVHYDRKKRMHGKSKYPFRKMLSFALGGITSFSVKPLRIVSILGLIVFAGSIILSLYTVYSKFFLRVVPGWASIVLPIYFLGGIQLLAIGIIGEYLGNVYREVKRRPRYIVDRVI